MDLRRKRIANAERVRELLDSAFASRYHDVGRMVKAASMAVVLAEEARSELPTDLIVAAWTEYGNALRISGRYEEAEKAVERAAAEPTSEPSTRVHLFEVSASLYRNTGKFDRAVQLLSAAIEIQRSIGDSNAEARHHNHIGIVYLDSKDRGRALRAFQTALDLLQPNAPLDLVASIGHNLMETLIADGRFTAAASALVLLEPFYRRLADSERIRPPIPTRRRPPFRREGGHPFRGESGHPFRREGGHFLKVVGMVAGLLSE
ncbi:MAG TPA: tetratricopeptide repeat protein [Thermoanaerobaculia bacterium]|nr:tetratricopeptide repeat protein [Thermoanaerobaculia bacterium]